MDIEQPLVIQEDRMRPLLAYMWMASKTSCIPEPTTSGGNTTITVGRDPEFEAVIDDKASGAGVATGSGVSNAIQTASESIRPAVPIPSIDAPSVTRPPNTTVTSTQDLPGTGFRVNSESTRWKVKSSYHDDVNVYSNVYHEPAIFQLTPRDVRR